MNYIFEWTFLLPSQEKEWCLKYAPAIGALGTCLAVLVALFKESVLKYCNRPKLDVLIEKKQPYILNIPQSENNKANGNALCLRFQVINYGKSLANNVAVKATEIRGEKFNRKLDMYLNPENIGTKRKKIPWDIPSKTGMYWDLGIIADPKYRKNDKRYFLKEEWAGKYKNNEPALLITVTYQLATGYHIVGRGKYEVDILIVADQIKARKKTILIDTSSFVKWPIDRQTPEEEEEEISEKIIFKVQEENKCYQFSYKDTQIRKRFCAYKSCIKDQLAVNKKDRFEPL